MDDRGAVSMLQATHVSPMLRQNKTTKGILSLKGLLLQCLRVQDIVYYLSSSNNLIQFDSLFFLYCPILDRIVHYHGSGNQIAWDKNPNSTINLVYDLGQVV